MKHLDTFFSDHYLTLSFRIFCTIVSQIKVEITASKEVRTKNVDIHKIPISNFSRQLENHNGRLKNRDQLTSTKTIGKGMHVHCMIILKHAFSISTNLVKIMKSENEMKRYRFFICMKQQVEMEKFLRILLVKWSLEFSFFP